MIQNHIFFRGLKWAKIHHFLFSNKRWRRSLIKTATNVIKLSNHKITVREEHDSLSLTGTSGRSEILWNRGVKSGCWGCAITLRTANSNVVVHPSGGWKQWAEPQPGVNSHTAQSSPHTRSHGQRRETRSAANAVRLPTRDPQSWLRGEPARPAEGKTSPRVFLLR